jgi:hypothetical protein
MENHQINVVSDETKVCKCCGRELPIESFFLNRFGRTAVCKDCANKHRQDAKLGRREVDELKERLESAKALKLSDFTPRELMAELKRRGYEGKITYTRIETIDLSTL